MSGSNIEGNENKVAQINTRIYSEKKCQSAKTDIILMETMVILFELYLQACDQIKSPSPLIR
jgi:hypothetical protein